MVRNAAIALAALIVVLALAGILVVRSGWFQNYVKQSIVTSVEDSTGARAEIGTFHFDWTCLSAVATDLVIHGTEPPAVAPMLGVARVELNLRLFTSFHHLWDITYLGVDRPQANVIVYPDGHTNIPAPRRKSNTNQPLQTIVDLAIGRFEITNGSLTFAAKKQALNVSANNFRAQLSYNILSQEYLGQLSLQPVFVVSGVASRRNTPVDFTINVPVVISRDRIDVKNASVFSKGSALTLSASIRDLKNPRLSVHAAGHIALADLNNAADLSWALNARNIPSVIDLDATASNANDAIAVSALHLTLGHSNLEASGIFNRGLSFQSRLALGELGRLLNQPTFPNDMATLAGLVTLSSHSDLTVSELRASALGGEFSGDASLKHWNAYQLRGVLKHFDLAAAIRAAGVARLPYDGVLSGPMDMAGNLTTGLRGLTAQARLSIAPGSHGIPLSGNLTADYSGARDDVSISRSLLALPHSRLSIDGSVGQQLNVAITTTNLDDLFAALPPSSRPAIVLRGDQASFAGKVSGSLSAPTISGRLTADRFSLTGREFDSFTADATITSRSVAIQNGSLNRNQMQAQFAGSLGLHDWKALPSAPLAVTASVHNGDLADLLALAGQPSNGCSGQLGANLNVNGTLGDPQGAGSLVVSNGMVQGQPFDRAEAQVKLTDQLVNVPAAYVELGSARVNLTGQFQHPRDSFTRGQLRAVVQSNRIDLSQLSAVQKQRPNTAGVIQLNVNATGELSGQFQITRLNGNASVRGLQSEGQNYGDLTANANTSGQAVNYNLTSNFAGSNINLTGSTQLARDYPTAASASLANLPVQRALAVADRAVADGNDIPVKGMLSGTANFTGTIANPTGHADLTLSNGTIYDDAVDRVHARLDYQPQSIDVSQLELASGPSRLDLTAHYDHAAGNLESGSLQFRVDTNSIDLGRVKTLVEDRPGLGGAIQVNLSGAAQLYDGSLRSGEPRVLVRQVNGAIKATGLAINGKKLGDLNVAANTTGGRTNFTLDSGMAGASIQGRGSVQLTNDYPTNAQVTFKNVDWAGLRPFLGYDAGEGRGFEASGDGQLKVNGPLMNAQQVRGLIQVTRLQVSGAPSVFHNAKPVVLQNQGPLAATLDRAALKIQSAHLTGPQTDFQATGTLPLNGDAMNLAFNGNVNLAILQQFDQAITSSGNIVLAAGVRGSAANPRLTGQVELHDASFDYTGLPTGVWKSNGVIALNGKSAVIRTLTAEAGGGRITVTGSATLSDTLRFGLRAKATRVRVMVQQGLGIVASANLNLSGTTESSSTTGTVTLEEVSYATRTDLGSLLSLAAPPVQTPSTPSPLLESMRLDIRVRSSSALGVQSSLAQNLELTTDLRVRGTAGNPGVLGRVQITEGKLLFFGSTYTVNNGTIAFYNPVRIEPVLDLSLQTETQGVNVVLKVTGPIDNMKLSYTSDPPLQFQEIVSLLATGTTPTSDPTLLANSPQLQPQSFQQMGESAIVGRALADPVTNQLQRVFGVTQLKINPAFTSGSQLPEAQLSVQQQISNNLTFTYVTGLNTANAETIQVQWTFTPQWSAQALRDYNGIFSVTLLYKRQFR
jgi:translocation and assembly module TamB